MTMGEIGAVVLLVLTVGSGSVIAVVAARHDARTHRLPNRLTAALAAVAVVGFPLSAVLAGEGIPWGRLALGSILCAGPWLVTHLVAPSQIGFGDVKLAVGLGLFLGRIDPDLSLVAVVAAGVLQLLYSRLGPNPGPVDGRHDGEGAAESEGEGEGDGDNDGDGDGDGEGTRRRAQPFGPALVGGAVLAGLLGAAGFAVW
jgi:prepilin signal peptidase PulO-like enzyme (type II secretory pathway)